jgi:hypothetical protein
MLARLAASLRGQYLGALALFIALGGTSFAADRVKRNSVGTKQIRHLGVKTSDIAYNAVTASRIAPNAVNSDDIEDGSIIAADINLRSLPPGPRGATGPRGPAGPAGASGSPDTPQQILDKLTQVDGAGSGLDADLLGGLGQNAFQRRVTGTCAAGSFVQSVGADGSVGCDEAFSVPLLIEEPDPEASTPVMRLTHAGMGNGLEVRLPATSGARGIDVAHSGVGTGVYSASTGGSAVWGVASSITTAAVLGDSPSGEVIVGRATGDVCEDNLANCAGIGAVVGRHDGEDGFGVRGFATDPNGGIGVIGQTGVSGGAGTGVRGENLNPDNPGNAVEGVTNGPGAGVYGTETSSQASALAARFDGNVQINGDLAITGTKSGFQIDDPSDPANRTLNHTPVETDALTVVYSGNVRTGADGRATVQLPAYASRIAGDWRYGLTPIGTFGQAIVEREVRHGAFVVRTEHPRTKVSWSVTGTRRDPYARSHPFRAVRGKTGAARGRYVHPAAYGQPASRAIARPPRTTARAASASKRPRLVSERRP